MPLTMGDEQAREIAELDRRLRSWLARERDCPLCNDPDYDDDEIPPEPIPDPHCQLCNGDGVVTGAQIEEWVKLMPAHRWMLPFWYTSDMLWLNRPDPPNEHHVS